ncbi:MAG: UDP-N-acetylmuramate dehydrogenase [Acidimicrobiales bacterium]
MDALVARAGPRAREHAPLGAMTTYRVGGRARVLVTASSVSDLAELAPLIEATQLPLVVIGNGSNLLVAEGEHQIVALHLVGEFTDLRWRREGDAVVVEAGAGADLPVVARRLAHAGISGFEWAVGVPGSVGGAVAMNAGGHGSDMAASVRAVTLWRGGPVAMEATAMGFAYRTSSLEPGDVVTAATLLLAPGDPERSDERIREIVRWRRANQPGGANGGSVFRNPEGDAAGRLIEVAGCKGLRVGSAVVSEKHANFILVDAAGRADDVHDLMVTVAARVREATGVSLEAENRLLGFGGR